MPPNLFPSPDVSRALANSQPVVALESTVITHGLPRPYNLELARDMEQEVRHGGATPATIAVIEGRIRVGLTDAELDRLANPPAGVTNVKISRRDFALAVMKKTSGGTTVAGTLFAAQQAGIRVFATGGIGGVHREPKYDISADLQALASTPVIVVCAGAKSILDLPSTLEYLETMSVPVVGYQTDDFPAFFVRESGLKVPVRLDSTDEIATFATAHWNLGLQSAVLVVQPVPGETAMQRSEFDPLLVQALDEAREKLISGPAMTPFLLERISALSNGRTLRANLSLLVNNASLAAQIARSLSARLRTLRIQSA
jgi:pseudouridine-5'-phosphate glycosidase